MILSLPVDTLPSNPVELLLLSLVVAAARQALGAEAVCLAPRSGPALCVRRR